VPCLRRLFTALSPLRPGFEPRSVRVIFVVEKVAMLLLLFEYFTFRLSISFYLLSILILT